MVFLLSLFSPRANIETQGDEQPQALNKWEELEEIEIRVGTQGQLWAVRGEQLSSSVS